MTTTYYKAIRPDGSSFREPTFKWATEPGGVTEHPNPRRRDASGYLSVSVVPTDCTGMRWPCRLLEVEPIDEPWTPDADSLPNKRAAYGFRTVRELPAHEVFGPQGEHAVVLLERIANLTRGEIERLNTAREAAARAAAWAAAWETTWNAAREAAGASAGASAWNAARASAWDAVLALLARDVLAPEHYETLTRPWRTTIGPLHPDDEGVQP